MFYLAGNSDRVTFDFARSDEWADRSLGPGTNGLTNVSKRIGIFMGDQICGPRVALTALAPGDTSATFPPHGHASDNFRLSLRGALTMGRDSYGDGEFRLQEGWKPYASDNYSEGPDGGWSFLVFADRRGIRADSAADLRRVTPEGWSSDGTSPGPSAIITSLGDIGRATRLIGSLQKTDTWPITTAGVRVAIILMGDPVSGPLLILTDAPPGSHCFPTGVFPTDVLRIVVKGSVVGTDRVFDVGDCQVQAEHIDWESSHAGELGAGEIILFGDRRELVTNDSLAQWNDGLPSLVGELAGKLSERLGITVAR